MAAFVRALGGGAASTTALVITTTGTATAGDTAFVAVRTANGRSVTSISDSAGGNTWHRDVHTTHAELWRCHVATKIPSGGTITVHPTGSSNTGAVAGLWSGLPDTPPDASTTATSGGSTTSATTLTAGAASDLWIGALATANSTAITPAVTPGTRRAFISTAAVATAAIADYSPGTVGPHTVTWSWTGSAINASCLASYPTAVTVITGKASLAATGTLSATGTVVVPGQVSLVATGSLSATGTVIPGIITGEALLSAGGTLKATGYVVISGQASFVASATLSAAGFIGQPGTMFVSTVRDTVLTPPDVLAQPVTLHPSAAGHTITVAHGTSVWVFAVTAVRQSKLAPRISDADEIPPGVILTGGPGTLQYVDPTTLAYAWTWTGHTGSAQLGAGVQRFWTGVYAALVDTATAAGHTISGTIASAGAVVATGVFTIHVT